MSAEDSDKATIERSGEEEATRRDGASSDIDELGEGIDEAAKSSSNGGFL